MRPLFMIGFLLNLHLPHSNSLAEEQPISQIDKRVNTFLECVLVTEDDALCFEVIKSELMEFVFTHHDHTPPTCENTRRKLAIYQKAFSKQLQVILEAAADNLNMQRSGLSSCLKQKAKQLTKVIALLGERAAFTQNEERSNLCAETFSFLSMLGIHAQMIGQQSRSCYSERLPKPKSP